MTAKTKTESAEPESKPRSRPSIGRIVHWINPATGVHCAAIITEVQLGLDDLVHLAVFRPDRATLNLLHVAEGDEPGTWHWPEMV